MADELAAYLIACRIEDCVNILILRSHSKHLKANPNNALIYVFTQEAISRTEINEISTGLESPQSDVSELERFKLRMGYQKIPIGQRIEFNHVFRPILRGTLLNAVHETATRVFSGENVNKFAGILRWYAEQPVLSMACERTGSHFLFFTDPETNSLSNIESYLLTTSSRRSRG